jgi:hypothetical protein
LRKKVTVILILALMLLTLGGCNLQPGQLLHSDQAQSPELVQVMIYFTDGQTLDAYVENLGMEGNSKIYTGGSSVNYLYNQNGKVIGCFNYQRVLYMKILPQNEKK